MNTETNTDFAWNLGCEYAKQFNDGPERDRVGLRPFTKNDDIPDGDYRELKNHYGDEISRDIENAYKDGFNFTGVFDDDDYTD